MITIDKGEVRAFFKRAEKAAIDTVRSICGDLATHMDDEDAAEVADMLRALELRYAPPKKPTTAEAADDGKNTQEEPDA